MPIIIRNEEYYTTQEAYTYLEVSRQTLDNMVKDGKLKKYRQGYARTIYYKKVELDRLRDMEQVNDE